MNKIPAIPESYQTWPPLRQSNGGLERRGPVRWPLLLARELVGLPLVTGLPAALEVLGRASGADRVYIAEYAADLRFFRNSHEWSRPGVASFVEDLQSMSVTLLGGLHRDMLAGHAVTISDVGNMPKDCLGLKAEFERQGNTAVLCLPLAWAGRLRGLFGFDQVNGPTAWSGEEVAAMFDCAELLARALYAGAATGPGATSHGANGSDFHGLLYLRNGRRLRGVPPHGVVGVRASGNASEVHMNDGTVLTDSRSLKQWEQLMPAAQFLRVHRGAMVRLASISTLARRGNGGWELTLNGTSSTWHVGRQALGPLRDRLRS